MKNKKSKIIAFVLVFVLLITAVVVTSVANAKTVNIQLESDKTELLAGESATISVKVTTNFSVATMSIPVFYDKTLVDVSEATATLTEYDVANTTTESQSVDTEKIYENTEIDSDKFGFVLVTYIGGANKEVAESIENEVVLTFKITAKTDVSGNAAVKVIQESAKTDDNVAGMLYFGATTNGRTINSIPENIEKIDLTTGMVSVKIGEEDNSLILNENAPFESVIDEMNVNPDGNIKATLYGFDTLGWTDADEYEFKPDGSIRDFFTSVYGEDFVEVIIPESGVETTGTIINILDENGEVIETYTYIYFGDIDMDGAIGVSDAVIAEYFESYYTGIDTVEQFMAADIDGDALPGVGDAVFMEYFESYYTGVPRQFDIASAIVENGIVYEYINIEE